MHYKKFYFIITLAFFALGFVNIHLALSGILCMSLPIILLLKNQKKTWCQNYCPRASLYTALGKLKKHSRKTPRFFTHGKMKWIVLIYFFTSLFIIIMSTIGVARGRIPAMEYLRFLIFLPLPFEMPQLITLEETLPWMTHLSYRFYSMMMTTTVLGLLLAALYKPRSWCTVCPIATVSDLYLNSARPRTGGQAKPQSRRCPAGERKGEST